jgi:hypothetical protein
MSNTTDKTETKWVTTRAYKWHAGVDLSPGNPQPIAIVAEAKSLSSPVSLHMDVSQAKEFADALLDIVEHVKKEKMI